MTCLQPAVFWSIGTAGWSVQHPTKQHLIGTVPFPTATPHPPQSGFPDVLKASQGTLFPWLLSLCGLSDLRWMFRIDRYSTHATVKKQYPFEHCSVNSTCYNNHDREYCSSRLRTLFIFVISEVESLELTLRVDLVAPHWSTIEPLLSMTPRQGSCAASSHHFSITGKGRLMSGCRCIYENL